MIYSRFSLTVGSLVLTLWAARAWADSAADAGRSHVAFAKALSADGLRFGAEDLSWLDAYEDSCMLSGLEAYEHDKGLPTPPDDESRKRLLQRYLDLYCRPWGELWFTVIDACDQKPVPTWCDQPDGLYKHLNLDAYFDSLTAALKASRTPLERYNVMAIMINAVGAHVTTELPQRRLEKWYALGTREYLRSATIKDAQELVQQFQNTWVGLMPTVVSEFRSYANAADGVSADDKEALLKSLNRRFSDSKDGGV